MDDIELLDYAVGVIDWMAQTGRLPEAGAENEEESEVSILGDVLPAIRARVLQHVGGEHSDGDDYRIEGDLSFDDEGDEDDC